jgi:leucyl aminopeptidase (aminopeptidase T)
MPMGTNKIIDAVKSADLIVRELLAIQPGEEVVLIADPETDIEMVQALSGVSQAVGAECTIAIMPSRPVKESLKMTKFIDKGLEAADVVIGMTKASGAACWSPLISTLKKETGLRFLSMVLRDLDIWTKGGATADYYEILKTGKRLQSLWGKGQEIYLTTEKGTNLKARIGGAPPFIEAGFATKPGQTAAFSDGEVSQGPVQGTAAGIVIVDGPIAHIDLPASPIRLEIEKGRVVKIEGDERGARELRDIVENVKDADNFAEIGIGLNPSCLQNGKFEEEKKRLGNVHIAVGRNTGGYGGTISSLVHLDMVIYDATVKTDRDILLQDGKLCV